MKRAPEVHDAPTYRDLVRLVDRILRRQDAEKASASQADAPAMKTDAPEP